MPQTSFIPYNPPGGSGSQSRFIKLPFLYLGGLPFSVTDREIYDAQGVLARVPIIDAGSMVVVEIFSATPIIAGSLVVTPTINGVKTPNNLNATLSPGVAHNVATIPENTADFTFTIDQLLGLVVTTSPDWNNNNGDIIANLCVQV